MPALTTATTVALATAAAPKSPGPGMWMGICMIALIPLVAYVTRSRPVSDSQFNGAFIVYGLFALLMLPVSCAMTGTASVSSSTPVVQKSIPTEAIERAFKESTERAREKRSFTGYAVQGGN